MCCEEAGRRARRGARARRVVHEWCGRDLGTERTFVVSERVASSSFTIDMAAELALDRIALVPGSE